MRVTLVAKRSTRAHRIEVINQLRHLVVCGPDRLRERLEDLSTVMVINTAAAMRPRPSGDIAADTTTRTVVELARRARQLGGHATILDARLNDLVAPLALELLHAPASAPTPPTPFSSPLVTTPTGSVPKTRGCTYAAQHRFQHRQAKPYATG